MFRWFHYYKRRVILDSTIRFPMTIFAKHSCVAPNVSKSGCRYSEDKRTSSGWYITENDEGSYEVGYVTQGGHLRQRLVYDTLVDACAAFVKREIENIILASALRPRASADQG